MFDKSCCKTRQEHILLQNVDLYDNPFDGSTCTQNGNNYQNLYSKNNEIGFGEITDDDLPFEKCAAFCRPYVDYKGYVGFGTTLKCFGLSANCNRCTCFFDAGFVPDTDFDSPGNNNVFTAVGPVNGATGFPGNGRCYPYKYYSDSEHNPYDVDDNGKFKLPIGILDDAHDVYGQITGQHLNTVLKYGNYIGGNNGIETTSDGPVFSDTLNNKIKKAFMLNSINVQIKIYQECVDDTSKRVVDLKWADKPRCMGFCYSDSDCNGSLKYFEEPN